MEENKPNRALFDSLSARVSSSDFRFMCSKYLMEKYLKAIQLLAMSHIEQWMDFAYTEIDLNIGFFQGDLHEYLKRKGALKPVTALRFAMDIASAQLTKAYQEANVFFEVLKIFNQTRSMEVDREALETHDKVAEKT